MERENRFSSEELKESRNKNYNLITDMSQKLNTLKGYNTAYTNPEKGKMIVDFNGQLFLVDVEPITCMKENTLENAMREYNHMFTG